ncbi:MAG: ATP phosphoribosyltransferase regulatory subunit [Christensenellales bacterium]|jgi:ATP phosphoribosyltransferase regulatory subunit HisZ
MTALMDPLDRITLALRERFESMGYRRYTAGRFEEYRLYMENRSFITGPVIAFTEPSGRLMALKSDVTMGIARRSRATREIAERYYYLEDVCRAGTDGVCRSIEQLGLEYIGQMEDYALVEVLSLAADCLMALGGDILLDVSHMGFLAGMMDALALPEASRSDWLQCVRGRNGHELLEVSINAGVPEAMHGGLQELPNLYGDWKQTLKKAEKMAMTRDMAEALEELERVCTALTKVAEKQIGLDFTMAGDMGYYNGIVFRGYRRGVPEPVLSGGQYDPLMRRFGKDTGAAGFALYLDALRGVLCEEIPDDILLLRCPEDDPAALLAYGDLLRKQGKRVRIETGVPEGFAGEVALLPGRK